MDSIIKNLRKKLSVDNIFTKGTDEPLNQDEDVRKTLEKTEPNDIIHIDEITEKLKELSEPMKSAADHSKTSQSSKVADKSKSSFSVLQKTADDEDGFNKSENVLAFLD